MANNTVHSVSYSDLRRLVFFIIALFLAYRFIDQTAAILTFFATSILIALLLNPVVVWLERKNISRTWAAIITLFSAIIFVGAIVAFAVPISIIEINELIQAIPEITKQLSNQLEKYSNIFPYLKNIDNAFDPTKVLTTPKTLSNIAGISQSLIGAIFLNALALFVIVYLLANPKPLLQGFFGLLNKGQAERIRNSLILLSRFLSRWFYTTFFIGVINGLIVSLSLFVIGVDFAIVFGLLLVIAEFVPYVGPLAVGIIAVIFGLSQSPLIALLVALIFIGVQTLESIIWGPLLLARSLELHPVSIIFAILAGETLLGIAGAVLALPLLIIIKIFFNEFYNPKLKQEAIAIEANKVMELER